MKAMPKTTQLVNGLLERLNLLLHVTIAPEGGGLTRSVSHMPEKTSSKFMKDSMLKFREKNAPKDKLILFVSLSFSTKCYGEVGHRCLESNSRIHEEYVRPH